MKKALRRIIVSKAAHGKRVLLVMGIGIFLFGHQTPVFADDTIVVRGQVGDVISGPVDDDESDDNDSNDNDSHSDKDTDKKNPPSPSQATVFIEPSRAGGANFSQAGGVTQFTTAKPAFQGTTNIQSAHISLVFTFGKFTLRAFLVAQPDGSFVWISPEDFPNGNFSVTAVATHPTATSMRAETFMKFSVLSTEKTNPWNTQNPGTPQKSLFDLTAIIQDDYRNIVPGGNIIAAIKVANFNKSEGPVEVLVEYRILDEQGNEVLLQQETVVVDGIRSYLKAFYTQPDMKLGNYRLIVKILSQNSVSLASADFTVGGKKELQLSALAKIDYTAILLIIGAIFFIFILLSYFEFIRFLGVKKKIRMVRARFLKRFL
jgi:hypothetical protein